MAECSKCIHSCVCKTADSCDGYVSGCEHFVPANWIPSNADCIRAMSDEELREFLCNNTKCEVCKFELWGGCNLRNWLKQPADMRGEEDETSLH